MARNFTQLKKSKTSRELNELCAEIATEYAISNDDHAESWFVEEYDISRSCYYKAKDYAVVRYLVTDEIVNYMRLKSMANQERNCSYGGRSTVQKYNKLLDDRKKYCVSKAREIARTIHPISFLLEVDGITIEMLYRILQEAFSSGYLSFEEWKNIQIKLLQYSKDWDQYVYVNQFFQQRLAIK